MKCTHIRFSSPLHGRISCEDAFVNTPYETEGMPVKADVMARFYDQSPALSTFLKENTEDVTAFIPKELQGIVIKIVLGDYGVWDGKMHLIHDVWVNSDYADDEELMGAIKEYITGQMSDGWGEGLEQREFGSETVRWETPYFDEYDLEFSKEEVRADALYFAEPWYDGFELKEHDREEEELDIHIQEVARFDRTYSDGFLRTIYLVSNLMERNILVQDCDTEEAKKNARWGDDIDCPTLICIDDDADLGKKVVFFDAFAREVQTPVGCRYQVFEKGKDAVMAEFKYAVATMLMA